MLQKNVLEQYAFIKKEIADLERRIRESDKKIQQLEKETVCDVVKGSRDNLSYGTIKVEGIAQQEIDWHWNLINKGMDQLQNYKKKLDEMLLDIEEYIETISDSEVRRIARFRCLDGFCWGKVAKTMGYGYTDDSCRQKYNRYLRRTNEQKD